MEEKERYVIRYDLDYNRCLIDTEKNQGVGDYIQIVKLLNQQSKRIKELEEELKNYKLRRCVDCSTEYEKGLETSIDELENEKAIKVLEMMIEEIRSLNMPNKPELYNNDMFVTGFESHYLGVERIIDNQIKSLKGEE